MGFAVANRLTKRELVALLDDVRDDDVLSLESHYEGRVIELNVEAFTIFRPYVETGCIWRAEA